MLSLHASGGAPSNFQFSVRLTTFRNYALISTIHPQLAYAFFRQLILSVQNGNRYRKSMSFSSHTDHYLAG